MRRRLAFAGDDDANVRHGQRILRLDGWCSAEGDEDALRGCRAVVDIRAASVWCCLDDLTPLDETLLTFIEHPERQRVSKNVTLFNTSEYLFIYFFFLHQIQYCQNQTATLIC